MSDRKTQFTRAIWQITQELNSAESLDNALASSLDIIIKLLRSEGGTIWLLDRDSNRLYPIFNRGFVDISGITIENGQGIAGTVVQSGEARIVEDTGLDDLFTRSVDEETGTATRNIICVPLKNSVETIGCIEVINCVDGSAYDTEDLALCESLARLAAIAMEEKGLQFRPSAEKEIITFCRVSNGSQILSDLSGKNLLEDGHIFFVFLLVKRGNREFKAGDRIPDMVNIATADQRGIAFVRVKPSFNFCQISLIHILWFVLSCCLFSVCISVPAFPAVSGITAERMQHGAYSIILYLMLQGNTKYSIKR